MRILTIGHSAHKIGIFLDLLQSHSVKTLVDVRAIPASRFNPQYNKAALEQALQELGMTYTSMKELGGRRVELTDSPNTGLSSGFRGFADYMLTQEFEAALIKLLSLAMPACIMCAEKLPSQCHRSLIADALLTRGMQVMHILPDGKLLEHAMTEMAHIRDGKLIYQAEQTELRLFG